MPDDEPRRSMVGAPPTTRRGRGGATPSTATPVAPRTSARASKRVKKEEPEEDEYKDDNSDPEKSEEEESDDSGDEDATPSRRGGGGGAGNGRKRKRAPLTDYHLKKKKILARKAQREAEREKEKEEEAAAEAEKPKEPTPPPARKPPSFSSYSPIQLMQDHILRKLVDKDPEQYFAFPVTPSMAPDYLEVIKEPMDLQTIREKIEDGKYESLPAMRADCQLIVANAMVYNQPNTVFYLAANRLANLITYYFGEQYVRYLFHSLPSANKIPFELVGLRPLASVSGDRPINRRRGVVKDEMSSDECLQNADVKVRDRLSAKLPESSKDKKKAKLAFLSQRNGTVVLNLVSGTGSDEKDQRKPTIGDIIGPLEEGTPGMIQMADHRLYSQAPINYLTYGPYSSFAPIYDSTWATMTKEDTDLFLRTYGDKSNASDVMRMRRFVGDCEEYSEMVESLLDSLTDGEHSKSMKEFARKPAEQMEDDELKNESLLALVQDVSSISNLGIETAFLDDVRKRVMGREVEAENVPDYMVGMEHMDVQQQLDHIGQEIQDLAHLQEARLAQPPPTMLMNVAEPAPVEQKLAENVQQHLAHQIATHVPPETFVNEAAIHDAMGVDMDDDDDLFSEFFVKQ